MLLIISTSTFIVLATVALLLWAGLVLWFTGRSKTKKATRPTPTLMSFFQPTAGKTTVDVPVPMASYHRSELILLNQGRKTTSYVPVEEPPTALPEILTAQEKELDDPTFAPALNPSQPEGQSELPSSNDPQQVSPHTGFQLTLDRQLLNRLLSDDSLCEQFEEARALTLERQRDTGRSYASLFREAIVDKPVDVQAVLLNLLTEDEVEDFDSSLPAFG